MSIKSYLAYIYHNRRVYSHFKALALFWHSEKCQNCPFENMSGGQYIDKSGPPYKKIRTK
jgi:hypothetical protein